MEHTAKFFVGQVIHHRRFDYRGVVYDVDATFQGTDEWYDQVAQSRPPKDQPWYHVLVHRAGHTTYVAERHLEPDTDGGPVAHPLLVEAFGSFRDGRYTLKHGVQ
jgi:heat shock protein HspQ